MTLQDTLSFIVNEADTEALDRIYAALRARQKALAAVRAAAVKVGDTVEVVGISPKYLNGLRGTVEQISGRSGVLLLDEDSTDRLRFTKHGSRDPNQKRQLLSGIPLQCFKV